MDPLATIEDLRAAARLLVASDDAGARRVGERVRFYLENAVNGAKFEPTLGLPPGEPWWAIEARETRDDAIRELARRFYADRKVASAAYEIERESHRYAASAWRYDRDRVEMPTHYAGTAKELLWRAFKTGAEMPLKQRQLQRILPAAKAKVAA